MKNDSAKGMALYMETVTLPRTGLPSLAPGACHSPHPGILATARQAPHEVADIIYSPFVDILRGCGFIREESLHGA